MSWNGEVVDDRLQVVPADVDLAVSRQDDAHVVAQPAQLLRQRGGDVRNATRLCEWRELRRGDQHLDLLRPRRRSGSAIARDPKAKRARRGHLLDVAALATHHQRHLHRLAAVPAERRERYGYE